MVPIGKAEFCDALKLTDVVLDEWNGLKFENDVPRTRILEFWPEKSGSHLYVIAFRLGKLLSNANKVLVQLNDSTFPTVDQTHVFSTAVGMQMRPWDPATERSFVWDAQVCPHGELILTLFLGLLFDWHLFIFSPDTSSGPSDYLVTVQDSGVFVYSRLQENAELAELLQSLQNNPLSLV